MEQYDISIVIPVRSDPLLDQALSSVQVPVEVVVSLNDPTAEVIAICEKWERQSKAFTLTIIVTDRIGMSAALNQGVRAARYQKIAVLDSDCTLTTETIQQYCEALERNAFIRGNTYLVEQDKFWCKQTKKATESLNERFRAKPRLFGPSIAFHKDVFLQLGGYDEEIAYGCDHEFAIRVEQAGYVVVYCENTAIWHQPITFRIDKRSHTGYGAGCYWIDRKHNTREGLYWCLSRVYPNTLYKKWVNRGWFAAVRSIMQAYWMLKGYIKESCKKEGTKG